MISRLSTRRRVLAVGGASSLIGWVGLPAVARGSGQASTDGSSEAPEDFPRQDAGSVQEVVGASHGRHDRVVELVTARPALAAASWDWGFGDWESALGAASHMGLPDTANFLMDHGARPNLFTYVMLGRLAAVQAMVEAHPGVQRIRGPHGITLLQHARTRLSRDNLSEADRRGVVDVAAYLESLGDADEGATSLQLDEAGQASFVGTYRFAEGADGVVNVRISSMGLLALARPGYTSRALHRVEAAGFAPAGSPAVRVRFDLVDGVATRLTVHDPMPIVRAVRVAAE